MPYLDVTNDEVKQAVTPAGIDDEDFYTDGFTEGKFEDLLERLEKRSRALIDNQLNGEGLEKETGRVDTFEAVDKAKIQLAYPVQDVKKVEVRTGTDNNGDPNWRELSKNLYRFTEQFVIYKGRLNQSFEQTYSRRSSNPLKRYSSNASWSDRCTQVKVTYDRGYDDIPFSVIEVQEELIRRMLTHLRQEQNLAKVNPQEVSGMVQGRRLLTDDLLNRVGKISQAKHKYTML